MVMADRRDFPFIIFQFSFFIESNHWGLTKSEPGAVSTGSFIQLKIHEVVGEFVKPNSTRNHK